MNIRDLLDPALLAEMLDKRFVSCRRDERSPVDVYDYTPSAQYKGVWNAVTLTCRGLLVHAGTGEIIARGMPKFFNYAEKQAPDLSGRPVEVYDKADGSLGILYRDPDTGRWAISTRGSLRSPQAQAATRILTERYATSFAPNPTWTYLFEIIAPASRIVVDYGMTEDLWLIGANDLQTGSPVPFDEVAATWPGPTVHRLAYTSLLEALAAPPRANAEGLVVLDPATGDRVKIKQEDYKRLHAVIIGLRSRDLWELLALEDCPTLSTKAAGVKFKMSPDAVEKIRSTPAAGLEGILARVPDEMFDAVLATTARLKDQVDQLDAQMRSRFDELDLGSLDQKSAALKVWEIAKNSTETAVLMNIYHGLEYRSTLWRATRPEPFDYVASTWQRASA